MKKSIVRMTVFAVSVALLCVGTGCDGNGRSVDWEGNVDGFLGRINETPGAGGGGGTSIRKVTVSSIGSGATGSGNYVVGQTVFIEAGTKPPSCPFEKWTSTGKDVTFNDATKTSTSFTMPANDVTVTANFYRHPKWGTFTDVRDNKTYLTTTIGGKTWMAENLNYTTSSGSWCYGINADNCNMYGRLYDWNTAKIVCPAGWHLPTKAEWDALVSVAEGSSVAGKHLKSQFGWNGYSGIENLDTYGFSALPGDGAGDYGNWWTATEDGFGSAYYRSMGDNSDDVYEYNLGDGGKSVRCIGGD